MNLFKFAVVVIAVCKTGLAHVDKLSFKYGASDVISPSEDFHSKPDNCDVSTLVVAGGAGISLEFANWVDQKQFGYDVHVVANLLNCEAKAANLWTDTNLQLSDIQLSSCSEGLVLDIQTVDESLYVDHLAIELLTTMGSIVLSEDCSNPNYAASVPLQNRGVKCITVPTVNSFGKKCRPTSLTPKKAPEYPNAKTTTIVVTESTASKTSTMLNKPSVKLSLSGSTLEATNPPSEPEVLKPGLAVELPITRTFQKPTPVPSTLVNQSIL
ncbi:uncharacterized protein CYBJADRAFT_183251 [Cyberlindnera jadinii NRRL Y-1542]|uniref:Uncharacterized protein n=1 Tax=Cyberlindnera jadinii (strain ATCC 18201 / CBS 1600 / BCRC 20928 / JCM 3617 / NBRC 0987 / NRRL Y-1542) TaxID=983966 RepID=A0A1E4S815_CYBJN|nr:hypothetical protein CYBJADRAFT_183251 [Cyberlindnera jadinii NRRL Y-1542]ODV75651.1 hypothetical protein CYBJADRAFT_183251 [Cyberlindnera jadinii NRRL Y-1542]